MSRYINTGIDPPKLRFESVLQGRRNHDDLQHPFGYLSKKPAPCLVNTCWSDCVYGEVPLLFIHHLMLVVNLACGLMGLRGHTACLRIEIDLDASLVLDVTEKIWVVGSTSTLISISATGCRALRQLQKVAQTPLCQYGRAIDGMTDIRDRFSVVALILTDAFMDEDTGL